MNIKIPQKSPALLILFLIYLNRIFTEVKKVVLEIILLFFINNLKFIAEKKSAAEIASTLEVVNKAVI